MSQFLRTISDTTGENQRWLFVHIEFIEFNPVYTGTLRSTDAQSGFLRMFAFIGNSREEVLQPVGAPVNILALDDAKRAREVLSSYHFYRKRLERQTWIKARNQRANRRDWLFRGELPHSWHEAGERGFFLKEMGFDRQEWTRLALEFAP